VLEAVDIIPRRAVSNAKLLATLMQGDTLCMERSNANLNTLRHWGS